MVQLNLEVIDSLLPEVMRAFGAVPKRGAEVGGLLIGSIENAGEGRRLVRVEQAQIVPCLYARGPSYLFTDEDRASFEQAREQWLPDPSRPLFAVGYFRSHTREGLSLSEEDTELLDRYFPDPAHIALLIRPFATKPVQAGFFFRDDGSFPRETPLPFIFSRRELSAEASPRAESLPLESPAAEPQPAEVDQATEARPPRRMIPLDLTDQSAPAREQPAAEDARVRVQGAGGLPGWAWMPLSIALLVIGAVAGIEAPKFVRVSALGGNSEDFSLGLAVSQSGDSLTVRWNSDAPAIRSAQGGVLEIEDDGYSKPVDLDSAHLQTGSIVYRNTSPSVRFRLTVYETGRINIVETADWPR